MGSLQNGNCKITEVLATMIHTPMTDSLSVEPNGLVYGDLNTIGFVQSWEQLLYVWPWSPERGPELFGTVDLNARSADSSILRILATCLNRILRITEVVN